jgi:hypothetical protein
MVVEVMTIVLFFVSVSTRHFKIHPLHALKEYPSTFKTRQLAAIFLHPKGAML